MARWGRASEKSGFFNSLLEVVFRHAIPEGIAGDFEETAGF